MLGVYRGASAAGSLGAGCFVVLVPLRAFLGGDCDYVRLAVRGFRVRGLGFRVQA